MQVVSGSSVTEVMTKLLEQPPAEGPVTLTVREPRKHAIVGKEIDPFRVYRECLSRTLDTLSTGKPLEALKRGISYATPEDAWTIRNDGKLDRVYSGLLTVRQLSALCAELIAVAQLASLGVGWCWAVAPQLMQDTRVPVAVPDVPEIWFPDSWDELKTAYDFDGRVLGRGFRDPYVRGVACPMLSGDIANMSPSPWREAALIYRG